MKRVERIDHAITLWMKRHGLTLLRYSLAIVFIWLGILKPLGLSPASELVARTVYWVSPEWFVPFLGWWEFVIGVCFLIKPLIRLAVGLMAVQMVGTFLPLILLPEVVYGPIPVLTLSLEGQYIIKNLVLIAAAIVVGSTVRDKK